MLCFSNRLLINPAAELPRQQQLPSAESGVRRVIKGLDTQLRKGNKSNCHNMNCKKAFLL